MMILVVGGSGSGKSSYAEETAVSLAGICEREISGLENTSLCDFPHRTMKKYYLATMQDFDEEGRKKVDRHRNLRKDKGFLTIEQPTEISRALEKMETGDRVVLLECMSNLTANEMFSKERIGAKNQVVEDIMHDIKLIKEQTTHFIVVSNNIFEDGITYDETTMEYIYAMGMLNQKLAALADQEVEVVAGIPVLIK